MNSNQNLNNPALSIMQEAVYILGKWAGVTLPINFNLDNPAIIVAKKLFSWDENATIKPLRLLFNDITIGGNEKQKKEHYWEAISIKNQNKIYPPEIPYPQKYQPELDDLKKEISKLELEEKDFNNLTLLTLLVEKFGSHVSFYFEKNEIENQDNNEIENQDNIAFYDLVKSIAAVAQALKDNPEAKELCLIGGDLSGIQKFIYTISADGALKSLRARSFFLELVTEEIVQQLLENLKLPKTNVIYAGGGNLYILADGNEASNRKIVDDVRNRFNDWLRKTFQGKLFLGLDYITLPVEALSESESSQSKLSESEPESELSKHWKKIPKKLAQQKQRKFDNQLSDFLKPQRSYEPCKVCHRDDYEILKPLNPSEPDSSMACEICRTMFELGAKLFNTKIILRTTTNQFKNTKKEKQFEINGYYYYLEKDLNSKDLKEVLSNDECKNIFRINNWNLEDYRDSKSNPFLLGNYGKKTPIEDEFTFMSASEMTEIAGESGAIPRVGYLRMDVDNLSKIFGGGLGLQLNLPRLAGLSRLMTYYFKVYLNTLAYKDLSIDNEGYNLLFIYAGGDDLFISGAWHEVVDFAFKIHDSFENFTGNNPSITLSAGVSLATSKYPLYQAARESGEAEEKAKGNGKDSLGLFGEVFKWNEWKGEKKIDVYKSNLIPPETKEYIYENVNLPLLGIKPFVDYFIDNLKDIQVNYSRNFIRNLLVTAQIQEQKIEEIEEERKKQIYDNEIKDIRYYLHLPKIAYTLARLRDSIKSTEGFESLSKSLKSPYNARYYKAIAIWLELLNRSK